MSSVDLTTWLINGSKNASDLVAQPRDEDLALVELATLSIIFIVCVIGNITVLLALAARGLKMTRMYYFLLHLCISDLVTAFFNVLPQLAWDATYRFQGGNVLCKAIKYLQILGPYLSSYVLVITGVDRYQAICFPLSNCTWTPRRSKLMIASAWIVAILCSLPQVFIFSYQRLPRDPSQYDCWGTFVQPWGEKAYVTWYAVSVFFIPLSVLTFTYVCISRAIWVNLQLKRKSSLKESGARKAVLVVGKSYRFRRKGQTEVSVSDSSSPPKDKLVAPRTHSVQGLSRAKIKTIKITVVVIMGYVVCSSPFICVQMWAYWCPYAQESAIWQSPLITILMLLASLNSCINPWIYLIFNHNLVVALQRFCSRRDVKDSHQNDCQSTYTRCTVADDTFALSVRGKCQQDKNRVKYSEESDGNPNSDTKKAKQKFEFENDGNEENA